MLIGHPLGARGKSALLLYCTTLASATIMSTLKLLHLQERIQRGERDIRKVDLSNDGLHEFPLELFEIKETVEFINLGNNSLASLPFNIHEFVNLKILFFAQNNFSKFPSQLKALPNLYMLSFKSNRLEEIPEDSLPSSLTWLILTDNRLKGARISHLL
jgi:Leucine-rich repeat (LRR) protein